MDERTALAVTALRAIETTDRERVAWTDDDRAWATRAAAEVVGQDADPATFIATRARLADERLMQRKDVLVRFARGWRWRPWVGVALALVAFAVGVVANLIGGTHRVNILHSPVLPLVVWNLAVYLVLAGGYVVRYGATASPGPLRRTVVWLAGSARRVRRGRDDTTARALAAFADDWIARAGPLYAMRAARLLHIASAVLALGVIAGLYVRGLGLEYRATWESTFLDPAAVRAIVAAFYAPGAWVARLAVPDIAQVAAIRAPASENAALWLHLMAATVAVVVVVPRLLFAALSGMIERYRARHLVDDLADPYFARLLRGFTHGPVVVDAVPYSFAVVADAEATLATLVARSLGGSVRVRVAPAVAYGNEAVGPTVPHGGAHPLLALFNATATPERETHGAFLATLAALGRPLVVVVDEASLVARFPDDARRRDERRALWTAFAAEAGQGLVFVDLAHPDVAKAEAAFDAALA
ncbi:MAG: DUF2868 domain-containing protein [Burkholderiales bacterium]|nr:DUF2868 domain-containing protein [Burkholderiales bacterium]